MVKRNEIGREETEEEGGLTAEIITMMDPSLLRKITMRKVLNLLESLGVETEMKTQTVTGMM
jgi:hypothetical protein